MDHKRYLQWLYTNCWMNHFNKSYETNKAQFCVATLEQVLDQTNYGTEDCSWKAVSFIESGKEIDKISGKPKHAEVAIVYKLPDMIIEYYKLHHDFPKNIYMFILHAPCISSATRLATMMYFDHGLWIAVGSQLRELDGV